jgi:hypothetical protein
LRTKRKAPIAKAATMMPANTHCSGPLPVNAKPSEDRMPASQEIFSFVPLRAASARR